jgi:Tol biopolymer transport system component
MRIPTRLLALAATIAGLALAAPAAAQTTSVNGDIAFTVCEYQNPPGAVTCDIWSMHPDGTEQTNLTNTPELNEWGPAWSPDGTRIAYVEGDTFSNRILVMNADGSAQTPVVPIPSYQFGPTWSADGTQLAFTREVPGEIITIQFDIFAVNVDGTNETNLTHSDSDEIDAAWSPDGTKIAFAGVRPETMSGGEPGAQWEIVTINPDGSGEQILTAGVPGTPRGDSLEEDRAPAWSPDSAMLVYMTQSVDPCCPPWQLEKVNRDGNGIVLLSDNPAVDDMFPAFSPDGTLIIFVSDRDGDLAFYTMPAPTPVARPHSIRMNVTPLPTPANASDPNWGRRVEAYAARKLQVDVHGSGGSSNLNGVLEPGESAVAEPSWQNALTIPLTFTGLASNLTGPAGPVYALDDTLADYGTVAAGATADCHAATPSSDCYAVRLEGARPATHWDATFDEQLTSPSATFTRTWTLHVGGSFTDVSTDPAADPYYPSIETLLHNRVSVGCEDGTMFCPAFPTSRQEMAVFLLKASHGAAYDPPDCAGIFADVPCTPGTGFSDWIEDLYGRGITAGCQAADAPLAYCPERDVLRSEMAVFLLKASQGAAYDPPDCAGIFADVPCTPGTGFSDWIEDLYNRGVTSGCQAQGDPLRYCPDHDILRQEMAVFLVKTFTLGLYGP